MVTGFRRLNFVWPIDHSPAQLQTAARNERRTAGVDRAIGGRRIRGRPVL
jgi:hypothetical protein